MIELTQSPDHAGLLQPFLSSRFRARFNAIPPGSASRTKLFNKLCHNYQDVLDWRQARPTASTELLKDLKELGAAAQCYCFCGPEEFDGREIPLAEALAALVGQGLPVLLICVPEMLAYFEPEHEEGSARRYIFQYPAGSRASK
jgi:hypothetical protein